MMFGLEAGDKYPLHEFFRGFAPDLADLRLSDFGLGLIRLADSDSESD